MGDVKDLALAKAARAEFSDEITPEQALKLALKDNKELNLGITTIFIIGITESGEDVKMHQWRSNLPLEKEIALLQGCVHTANRRWVDGTEEY